MTTNSGLRFSVNPPLSTDEILKIWNAEQKLPTANLPDLLFGRDMNGAITVRLHPKHLPIEAGSLKRVVQIAVHRKYPNALFAWQE